MTAAKISVAVVEFVELMEDDADFVDVARGDIDGDGNREVERETVRDGGVKEDIQETMYLQNAKIA